ncbi:MAG: endo alpha-1,4 polygalactosaminidase [Myxococcales bacterium]|nr:endo alpha-1,4 polygalactosaminidase [Myxococcales bacterium]
MSASERALLLAAGLLIACGDGESGTSGGGASDTTSAGPGGPGATSSGSSGTATTASGTSTGTAGTGGGLPAYASFHLNYTQDIDFSKCAERDFVVFDMEETPPSTIDQCKSMGATMLCYFSSQYEEWRADAGSFGALAEGIDGWPGEFFVDPTDPQNLAVMVARLDQAKAKGCEGIDLDNIDHADHEAYISSIFTEARARGLLVSQKNAIEKIDLFWDLVDMYQNEECQMYDECAAYEGLGRPVYNIEYSPCHTLPYLYSNRKDVEAMDAWEEPCAP